MIAIRSTRDLPRLAWNADCGRLAARGHRVIESYEEEILFQSRGVGASGRVSARIAVGMVMIIVVGATQTLLRWVSVLASNVVLTRVVQLAAVEWPARIC